MENIITPQEGKILIDLARKSIYTFLKQKEYYNVPNPETLPSNIKKEGACFVTLKINKKLRGCIGSLIFTNPLYIDVIKRAVDAAFFDSRFPPLTEEEFEQIKIEITILSKPKEINSLDEFKLGKHGIILEKYGARAVFLPQVATEYGWTKEELLYHLSLKAGLSPNAWKEGAQFKVFTAQIINEED